MKRVVLDTNIYISGLVFAGSNPREILGLSQGSFFVSLTSKQIISELRGVLRVKFNFSVAKLDLMEDLLINSCELIEPTNRINFIKEDSEDNKILECALEGKADIIVSGDNHLLKIKEFKGIKIIKVIDFLEEIKQ